MRWTEIFERGILWSDLEKSQRTCLKAVQADPQNAFLLISEPQPTFTSGVSARAEDCLWTPSDCQAKNVRVEKVSRGGSWTYHGPGQLVVFPIVSLASLGYGSRETFRFVSDFRTLLLNWIRRQNIAAVGQDRPFGIYTEHGKLASFGIGLKRGVCQYGAAIYLKNQNDFFRGIHPCGVRGEKLTSLADLGAERDWETAAGQISTELKKGFKPS